MSRNCIPFLFLFLMFSLEVHAQDGSWEPDFSTYLEAVFDAGAAEITDDVHESLLQLYHHPINLNAASREDLQSILLFNDQEISEILKHRMEYGNFLSFQELYLVDGMDSAKVTTVRDFFMVEPAPVLPVDSLSLMRRIIRYGQGRLILRFGRMLEKRKGFQNRNDPAAVREKRYYLGTPDHANIRLHFEVPGEIHTGLTAEKDPGEKIFFSPESHGYGFDHYAGYLQKHFHFWLKHITIGDYQIQAGQGLVLGSGLFVGKGTEPIRTTIRHDHGARPYQGSTEFGFYRGLALDFGGRRWATTAFVSYKGLDASTGMQNDTAEKKVIRSLIKTGYHRTPVELGRKNAASMGSAGFVGRYRSIYNNFSIGFAGIWNRLDLPVSEYRNYYNFFDFSGRDHFNAGINYNYYKGKFNVFGEIAFSRSGGMGMIQGIMANLSSSVETVLHFRHYDKNYFSFMGRAFGEYEVNSNEQGIYWGLNLQPLAFLNLHFYFDLFRSCWLRYGTAAPGNGNEWMTHVNFNTGKFSGIEIYYQEENKDRNLPAGNGNEYTLSGSSRKKARIGYQYNAPGGITLRSRIQGTSYGFDNSRSYGFALIQDLGFKFRKGYIKSRLSWFYTQDYQTRQYVYEPDVLFYFSSPAYYGNGIRYLILFKITPCRNIDFWLKFGQYFYFGQDTIGSGL
ncbi:MAG: helix-hairpin-helix domain-containing protein, partial [Cyclobacteriaceae bacterium]|nr:helix-hairpin-helix domain-containing protein [Cyclobacteriaceae bacterium]